MGNQGSKRPQYGGASMFIEIEGATQIAGGKIKGKVHLQSAAHWPNGDKLYILLEGKEKCKWVDEEHRTVGSGEDAHVEVIKHKRKGKEVFMTHRELVFDFAGGVPQGQWSFPFEMELPNWSPSSFFLCGAKKSKLQIAYKVRAEIHGNNGECVEAKRRIVVRRPPFEMSTGQNMESTQKITVCCCMDKG
jgi:hypothetical protein